jgi:restriction system-associated AAA family ATPase
MNSGYRSLDEFDCVFHLDGLEINGAEPICLVGLIGSGKSNLIEAIADAFCFLELINLPWERVRPRASKFRENRHRFEIEYTVFDQNGRHDVRIRKTKNNGISFFVVDKDGNETPVETRRDQLLLLPRRIIGYSSGLNETVSHPFLRTRTIYSEEVRDAAPPEGDEGGSDTKVFDTRTLYMDYDSNEAIVISNYIFREPDELSVFKEYTRVSRVAAFDLRFSRRIAGKSGPNSTVRLTSELKSYLQRFLRCAGQEFDEEVIDYKLHFDLNQETILRFRSEFGTAEHLFMAMHRWSLLNALVLSGEQRNVYLRSDVTSGALERPPTVPKSERVFDIDNLKIRLTIPDLEIDYSGLSDGEHQFIQVFGTAVLFSEPGTLFLFDEPESHFNPEWRTRFNLILNSLPNAASHEYVISTHSPYLVSGCRQGNVYKFERRDASVTCCPVEFETYGASFEMLLRKLFSVGTSIDLSARDDLEHVIRERDLDKMQDAVGSFAESREKRRLYEAIIVEEERRGNVLQPDCH